MAEPDLKEMAALIRELRTTAARLQELSEIPAVVRNCERILASVRMLELNISEALTVLEWERDERGSA